MSDPEHAPEPRKGMPDPELDRVEFGRRFLAPFTDPIFEKFGSELEALTEAAWDAYSDGRKSPRTRAAGPGYADPEYELSVDWIAAKDAIDRAQAEYERSDREIKFLLVNASPRSEHTCPGEMSKTFRMAEIAKAALAENGAEVEVLDLSRLTSEYGRQIHPCKACFSTAAPLCNWPCSCYPNYSLGQTQDWMNEIFPMWVAADGIMIVTPVHWYQVTSPLKLMMDRLVCADGGNPDPTLTQGKKAKLAKEVELEGWEYPRHLEGRLFSVVVHGDVEGAENVRRSVSDWLRFMHLESAGKLAELDRYIGYWKPYATSHDEFDEDHNVQQEVRNAAVTLREAVEARRKGVLVSPGAGVRETRQK